MKITKVIQAIFSQKTIDTVINILTAGAKIYYSWRFDPFIIRPNKTDRKVLRNIFTLREMSLPISLDAKLIIDGGAYTGLSSLFFALQYPNATIMAVEPEAGNFSVLEKHASQYKERLISIRGGLWPTTAKLKVTDPGTGSWGFMVEEVPNGSDFDVQGVTICDLMKQAGCDEIDILKLDIEGAEKDLFERNTDEWIDKVKVIIVEFHDRKRAGARATVEKAIDLTKWNCQRKSDKMIYIRKDLQ